MFLSGDIEGRVSVPRRQEQRGPMLNEVADKHQVAIGNRTMERGPGVIGKRWAGQGTLGPLQLFHKYHSYRRIN